MKSYFSAEFFKANRQRLQNELKLAANEIILVPAHSKLQKKHDEAFKFAQDSNFFYLTGINEPDCILILTRDSEMLLSPAIKAHHQLWEGQAGLDQMQKTSGIAEIYAGQNGWAQFRSLLGEAKKVYLPMPYNGHVLRNYYRMVANPARSNLFKKVKALKNIKVKDLRPALAILRMIKQEPELAAIRQAINITGDSIKEVTSKLAKLGTEQAAIALMEYEFLRRGADGIAFDTIIASGSATTQIHYVSSNQKSLDKSLVLMDVGAQVQGYAADISRVVSLSGFTPRQQEVYDAVKTLQDYAISLLKTGIVVMDFEEQMERKTTEMTAGLRLAKHKTIRNRVRITPHMVCHHLGLDAHDAADYQAPLQPGMVFAVEPGIYLPEEGIGMRIEDNILITSKGNEILSASLPRLL